MEIIRCRMPRSFSALYCEAELSTDSLNAISDAFHYSAKAVYWCGTMPRNVAALGVGILIVREFGKYYWYTLCHKKGQSPLWDLDRGRKYATSNVDSLKFRMYGEKDGGPFLEMDGKFEEFVEPMLEHLCVKLDELFVVDGIRNRDGSLYIGKSGNKHYMILDADTYGEPEHFMWMGSTQHIEINVNVYNSMRFYCKTEAINPKNNE